LFQALQKTTKVSKRKVGPKNTDKPFLFFKKTKQKKPTSS